MILAMGAGLGVVAPRVAGIPEVVKDGETGLLVPPGDVGALGAALGSLAGSPEVRQRLGASAREFVRPRFGADGYVAAVAELYDRLLLQKGLAA
jgi:glycosyltransferase involved in cell wall biosynthesis